MSAAGGARVFGPGQVAVEAGGQVLLHGRVARVGGEVPEAVRVVADGVEFLRRAPFEGEAKQLGILVAMLPEEGLAGAAVGVAEAADRLIRGVGGARAVAGGVAVGGEVADMRIYR